MPTPIENSIRKQNIKFLHHRSQFSVEYFSFIRKLVSCNAPPITLIIKKLVCITIGIWGTFKGLILDIFSESRCGALVDVINATGVQVPVPHGFPHKEKLEGSCDGLVRSTLAAFGRIAFSALVVCKPNAFQSSASLLRVSPQLSQQ